MDSNAVYALIALLPAEWRELAKLIVDLLVQVVAFCTVVGPLLVVIVKRTPWKGDDALLARVQKLVSWLPRVQVPAISQRPPVPPAQPTDVK